MKFKDVACVFETIEQEPGRIGMTKLLAQLMSEAEPQEAEIMCNLSLGQLHPPYIGTQFNIAEKSMMGIVAHMLDESETDVKAQMKQVGDLGEIVAAGSWKASDTLTIVQVYQQLCSIEEISGTGSQETKAIAIQDLLTALDTLSAKYIVRIILGKLRLGFSEMTIIDALSWMEVGDKSLREDIEHAYNICVDIGRIAATLKEKGIAVLQKQTIKVGIPIRPAAAERLPSAMAIIEKIGTCIAQPKLDGFRLQIHVDKSGKMPKIHFFSRHLQDMSAMFPDIVPAFAALEVDTLICEGEAIGYDPNTGGFLPFQETVKRKRKHDIEQAAQDLPLQVFVFDLLYYNGQSYLDKPHDERYAQLSKILKKADHAVINLIEEKVVSTGAELNDYFNENIAAGLEGLVVKRPDSIYTPGKRNFNWIKLKRQEEGELEDTVDCVILGYYQGRGKRARFGIGAFLVGVYNKSKDLYQTVAKVGTGLTDEQFIELKIKCDKVAVKAQPHDVECAKELAPAVWTTPDIVCEILADEITRSPLHTAAKTVDSLGYALRFPRFIGYRPDKGPEEATQVTEIKRLFEDQFKK
jgi:DNA ligase 1